MAFDEIAPEAFEVSEGAEEQEIAEPVEEEVEDTGEEAQELAEPVSEEPDNGRTAADAKFAEMRRQLEEAERMRTEMQNELNDLKTQQAARQAALAHMDVDEIDAIAETLGITREEVLENIQKEEETAEAEIKSKEKDQQIAELQEKLNAIEAEKMMAEDLAELQKIDSSIQSLDDLGDDFYAYIAAGLDAEQAYYAVKGKEISTKATPAKPPGKVTDSAPPEKEYYTEEEVSRMTSQERYENAEKIMASLPKWKKK